MNRLGGWNYWIKEQNHVRQFTVAEADEDNARGSLQSKLPNAEFLARSPLSVDVTRLLQMTPQQIAEWTVIDSNGNAEPDPKFGAIQMQRKI